jgi:tRNA (guanosine-2'-O-)-methyltransferase
LIKRIKITQWLSPEVYFCDVDNKTETLELITYLEQFVSEKRKVRFKEVLANRTAHLTVVLENIFQSHNASAVLRSCDCFGVQHVHFIENRNTMKVNDEVAMGSSAWLNIHRHREKENNTLACLRQLKEEGFRIVVTSPHKKSHTPANLPLDQKVALVFGTEMEGVSPEAMSMADDFLCLPMYGFTESFNISVCAALCMYDLSRRIRQEVPSWQLGEAEQTNTYLSWLTNSIDHSEAIIRDYRSKKKI